MDLLPVLDLLNGVVVRGVAGRRSEYRPLTSTLTTSIEAVAVARALRKAFGFTRFYVADLDAIMHQRPHWKIYTDLVDDGFQLLIDAGIQNVEQSLAVQKCGAEPVVGLESCPDPDSLRTIVAANQGHVTFSLDLQEGRPLLAKGSDGWSRDPLEIVRQSVDGGVQRIIVLDLADVGTSSGGQTEGLCRSLRVEFPGLALICGGGVRDIDDLRRHQRVGVSGVLVASALHNGRITAQDLGDFNSAEIPHLI